MSHHTEFDRAANATLATREREKAAGCGECGGRYWGKGSRVWHEHSCSQYVLRSKSSREAMERKRQDREAAALRDLRAPVLPSCPHGFESMLACPGCSDAADRHNERAVEL